MNTDNHIFGPNRKLNRLQCESRRRIRWTTSESFRWKLRYDSSQYGLIHLFFMGDRGFEGCGTSKHTVTDKHGSIDLGIQA